MKLPSRIYFTVALAWLTIHSFSQNANFQWARAVDGTSLNQGLGVVVDATGNVYTTGHFSGSSDFDPGIGTFSMTSFGSNDVFIQKLDPSGNFIWAKQMGGTTADISRAIALDASGNIYTTGSFYGTADFDPGLGVFNLNSAGNDDIFISKLDPAGNFIWAKQMGGSSTDVGKGIAIDPLGNIVSTGYFLQDGDFDPGPGTYSLTTPLSHEIYVSKLDPAGNFIWAKQMGGASSGDQGHAIAVDAAGNIYTTGYYTFIADFDPGPGTYNLNWSGNFDIFVSKLNSAGNFVWARGMGASSDDFGYAIKVDNAGNVYTTGSFKNIVDFDPGPATFSIMSNGSEDVFVSKLNASGNFVWARSWGAGTQDIGYGMDLDSQGDVYIAGSFSALPDFDPGPGTFTIASPGGYDIFVSKLNSAGNFVWAKQMAGIGNEEGRAIYIDNVANVYTTGHFYASVDFDPNAGVYNLSQTLGQLAFVHKMCQTPSTPSAISGSVAICLNSSGIYTVSLVPYATSYTWSLPAGWSSISAANSITATPGASGIFSIVAINSCGTSSIQTAGITVNPLPTITVNSGSICTGNSFIMVPNGAHTYTFSSGLAVVSPTISTSYSVMGTSTAGCISSSPAISNVSVYALPLPTVSVNSGTICLGQSFTILPTGAFTYTYSSTSPVVTPTINTSYSITGTSSLGCVSSNSAISNVTVHALPVISVFSGSVCPGESFTISPTGANTYTIQGGNAIVSPTTNTSYSVSGTNTAGCVSNSFAVCNVTVNPLPIITIVSSDTIICIGQSATLTSGGGNTYTWSTSSLNNMEVVSPSLTTTYSVTGTDANGCQNTAVYTQSVDACTGIKNNTSLQANNIKIYPNPNKGIFTVELIEVSDVFVTNAIGQMILKEKLLNGKHTIDLSTQANGIYFMQISSNNSRQTFKIIKE